MIRDFKFELDRSEVLPQLVGDAKEYLFIGGLGGTARDTTRLTDGGDNLFALGGAMGAAAMMGLGLALAQPKRKVLVITGDGELLMNLGALATISVLNPTNLSIHPSPNLKSFASNTGNLKKQSFVVCQSQKHLPDKSHL